MEFYFPTEFGEQLAFAAATATVLLGLFMMFAPGFAMRLLGLMPREGRNEGFSEIRAIGGFYTGAGLSAVLLAQHLIYLSLGAAFAFAAFARVLSILSDSAGNSRNFLFLIVDVTLAALPLAYVFQLV